MILVMLKSMFSVIKEHRFNSCYEIFDIYMIIMDNVCTLIND